ncbi:pyrrolidone-carboxylate peptidase [Azospirillum sp.]|uniref:pyroglutamyl-peptidase I family protein n=1 Tax=Azospirillum sp. TaxID=34012 RepID=UPI003D731E9A
MTAPILLTGFQPFGSNVVNPTMLLMERLAGMEGVVTATLPVEYGTSGDAFEDLLDKHEPAAVLCFGLAAKTDVVLVERVAWNRDETEQADNTGLVRQGVVILEDAPPSYACGFPAPVLVQALEAAGVPVDVSDDAGGYVCNHLYYRALHAVAMRGLDTPVAFIHVPPLPEHCTDRAGGLAFERLEAGVRALIEAVRAAA